MEKSIADLAENKVLILYLLNKLPDGIKSDNLYKIVSSANNINYFNKCIIFFCKRTN